MAGMRRVYFDRTEVVVSARNGTSVSTYNLVSNNITRITFECFDEYRIVYGPLKLFPRKSQRIVIVAVGVSGEIVLLESQNKGFFEAYKEEFREYAQKYRIQLIDNTQET